MEEKIDYKKIIEKIKPEMEKIIVAFEEEIKKIKTTRAAPALVEDLIVECFGQKFPLKQLAQIFVSGPRQILIQPWDKSYVDGIIKAIEQSGLGLTPIVDKETIKINLPPLSEQYRKDLLRILAQKKEQARQKIRHQRERAWDEIQERFREGKIREDDKYKGKDELQDLIDEYNEKIEEIAEKKKKEIET